MSELEWVFDPVPPSGRRSGGDPASYVFKPDIDALVREVIQNANDQRVGEAPVQVDFNLRELSDVQKQAFLEAADWDRLEQHLHGVAESKTLINGQVASTLKEIARGSLFVLQVQDRGTKGLTGTEDGTGNFGALCKHVLVTNDEKAAKGGSYGLGKAVLWRFSALSTVLFGSVYEDEQGVRTSRLFGNTGLPYHLAEDSSWDGPGFFGQRSEVANGARAESLRTGDQVDISRDLLTGRSDDYGRGTTAVVVGFSEPAVEARRPLPEVAHDIAAAASRWFWPRIVDGTLKVVANAYSGVDLIESVEATPDLVDNGFIDATALPVTGDRALSAGDVVEREIEIRVPRKNDDPTPGHVTGSISLRLIRTGEDDDAASSSIALVRGAGMVVKYYKERRLPLSNGGYRAVLLAGARHGSDDSDGKIEEFFRSAEPPAHDEWIHSTNALKSHYRPGSQTRLGELWEQIRTALMEMLVVQSGGDEKGPAQLAKYFRIGNQGTSGHDHSFQVEYGPAHLDGRTWKVTGKARRTRGDRAWYLDLSAKLEGEGRNYPMTLANWTASAGTAHLQASDQLLRVDLAAGQSEVSFAFDAVPGADEIDLISESRMRVDARTHQSEV